jgi:hypothetical protein
MSKNKHLIEGIEPKYYARIPNMVIDDLPYAELALYTYYKRVAYDTGACWQSTATIGKSLGMSPKKVRATRRELEKKNLVHVSGEDGKTKTIRIVNVWEQNIGRYNMTPVQNDPPPGTIVPTPGSNRTHEEKDIRTTNKENKDLSPPETGDDSPPPLDGVIIDTKICRICGQSMPEWAECTRCATIHLDDDSGHDAIFCDDCGGLLSGGAPDNTYIHCICDNGRAQYVKQPCGCVWYMVDGKHDESRSTYCDKHTSASKRNGSKYGACDDCGRFVYDGDCRHCEKDTIVSNLGADNTPVAVKGAPTMQEVDAAIYGTRDEPVKATLNAFANPKPKATKKPRKRKPTAHTLMKNALVEAMGYTQDDITCWGDYNSASKKLRAADVTPEEVADLHRFSCKLARRGKYSFKSPMQLAKDLPEYRKQKRQEVEMPAIEQKPLDATSDVVTYE